MKGLIAPVFSLAFAFASGHAMRSNTFEPVAPELQSTVPAIPGNLLIDIVFHYFNGTAPQTSSPSPGTQEVTTVTHNTPSFYAPSSLTNGTSSKTLYTLLALDSSTSPQQLLHYLHTDLTIPPSPDQAQYTNFTNGSSSYLLPWLAPDPQIGTPQDHDYTVILYKQPSNFTLPTYVKNPAFVRIARNFTFTTFLNQTGLKEPVAANYFRSENATGYAPSYISPTPLSSSDAAAASASQTAMANAAAGRQAELGGTVGALALVASLFLA